MENLNQTPFPCAGRSTYKIAGATPPWWRAYDPHATTPFVALSTAQKSTCSKAIREETPTKLFSPINSAGLGALIAAAEQEALDYQFDENSLMITPHHRRNSLQPDSAHAVQLCNDDVICSRNDDTEKTIGNSNFLRLVEKHARAFADGQEETAILQVIGGICQSGGRFVVYENKEWRIADHLVAQDTTSRAFQRFCSTKLTASDTKNQQRVAPKNSFFAGTESESTCSSKSETTTASCTTGSSIHAPHLYGIRATASLLTNSPSKVTHTEQSRQAQAVYASNRHQKVLRPRVDHDNMCIQAQSTTKSSSIKSASTCPLSTKGSAETKVNTASEKTIAFLGAIKAGAEMGEKTLASNDFKKRKKRAFKTRRFDPKQLKNAQAQHGEDKAPRATTVPAYACSRPLKKKSKQASGVRVSVTKTGKFELRYATGATKFPKFIATFTTKETAVAAGNFAAANLSKIDDAHQREAWFEDVKARVLQKYVPNSGVNIVAVTNIPTVEQIKGSESTTTCIRIKEETYVQQLPGVRISKSKSGSFELRFKNPALSRHPKYVASFAQREDALKAGNCLASLLEKSLSHQSISGARQTEKVFEAAKQQVLQQANPIRPIHIKTFDADSTVKLHTDDALRVGSVQDGNIVEKMRRRFCENSDEVHNSERSVKACTMTSADQMDVDQSARYMPLIPSCDSIIQSVVHQLIEEDIQSVPRVSF